MQQPSSGQQPTPTQYEQGQASLQGQAPMQSEQANSQAPYDPQGAPPLPARHDGQKQSNQSFPSRLQHASGASTLDDDNVSSPVHYTRDPHRLVAYLVPFPKPQIKNVSPDKVPTRFLIYTPPPPPLSAPKEGEKEAKFHKVQRKWQEEVRSAKTSDAKTMSWKGIKGKATKGINTAMGYTTNSNLDFLTRIGGGSGGDGSKDKHADDGHKEDDATHRTVGLEEMVLVYPSNLNMSQDQLRTEFVNTMLRSKTKAERDAVLATGLLPISAAIDLCATLIWPFGGLLEIDGVWAYASIRGAKTSRSVTKRLTSSSTSGKHDEDKLKLNFTPSQRLEVLDRYLAARCHEKDPKVFSAAGSMPTESEVLEAIGWSPSQTGGEQRNWEDEQWEVQEVKDDVKLTLGKGAKEWEKWVKAFEKDPEKAMKK